MVKFRKGIIVSSNFADVADYAQQLGLAHIGTIDILKMAFQKGLITSEQALNLFDELLNGLEGDIDSIIGGGDGES